jgi:hypothetical protein
MPFSTSVIDGAPDGRKCCLLLFGVNGVRVCVRRGFKSETGGGGGGGGGGQDDDVVVLFACIVDVLSSNPVSALSTSDSGDVASRFVGGCSCSLCVVRCMAIMSSTAGDD